MTTWQVELDGSFEHWRDRARRCLAAEVRPDACVWASPDAAQRDLFARSFDELLPVRAAAAPAVPKYFIQMARKVAYHRDPGRWGLLYRVLWRLAHGSSRLLEDANDSDVRRLRVMEQAVRRDAHKTKAFVRFKHVQHEGVDAYVAWHRTDHFVLPVVAPFFVDRFRPMLWSIITPDASMHWDGTRLSWGAGAGRDAAPADDALEDLWRDYYRSIFNPARVKWGAMLAEMPMKHWATLPEARVIRELMREAPARVEQMVARNRVTAAAWVPPSPSLDEIRSALPTCGACELCGRASGPVPGVGPADAALAVVGEQPGDEEDRAGVPFVGPADRLLDQVLERVGVPRERLYVTNAVKAFRFDERSTESGLSKRWHARPDAGHVEVCRPWLSAELAQVRPQVVLCLGASAGRSVVGRAVAIARDRDQTFEIAHGARARVSYHPAAVLRAPPSRRPRMEAALAADIAAAWRLATPPRA